MYQIMCFIYRLLLALFLGASVNTALADTISAQDAQEDLLIQGRSFFHTPWVAAPSSTTARDGLGPLFNANTCTSCHPTKMRTKPSLFDRNTYPDSTPPLRHFVAKLSQYSQHHHRTDNNITVPDPVYGYQIAVNGIPTVSPEAKLNIQAKEKLFTFADGYALPLRYWQVTLDNLTYGALSKGTAYSLRIAPFLMGLSWIEQIPIENLRQQQAYQQLYHPTLAGRVNQVYHPLDNNITVGKFGWKASQANLITQTADAAFHDMGLTSLIYPHESCTQSQTDCLMAAKGRSTATELHDLTFARLISMARYTANLPLPKAIASEPPASLEKGKKLFITMQCAVCHQAEQKTAQGKPFYPYSDFLLHDMGDELADQRPEFEASGQEWRTAPLWRNRYKTHFLHDGRARTLLEAIAWHGGQAAVSRQHFQQLSEQERHDLIQFLESL